MRETKLAPKPFQRFDRKPVNGELNNVVSQRLQPRRGGTEDRTLAGARITYEKKRSIKRPISDRLDAWPVDLHVRLTNFGLLVLAEVRLDALTITTEGLDVRAEAGRSC